VRRAGAAFAGLLASAAVACTIDINLGNPATLGVLMDAGELFALGQCPAEAGEPAQIVSERGAILARAVDATHVYYVVTDGDGAASAVVKKVAMSGGAATTVASGRYVSGVAVTSGALFFNTYEEGGFELRELGKGGGAPVSRGRGPSDGRRMVAEPNGTRVVVANESPDELVDVPVGGGTARRMPLGDLRVAGPLAADAQEIYAVIDRSEVVVNPSGGSGQPSSESAFEVVAFERQGASAPRSVLGALSGHASALALDSKRVWVAAGEMILGVGKERSRDEVPVVIPAGAGGTHVLHAEGGHVYWLRASDGALVRHAASGTGSTEVVQSRPEGEWPTSFSLARCSLVFESVSSAHGEVLRTTLHRRARP